MLVKLRKTMFVCVTIFIVLILTACGDSSATLTSKDQDDEKETEENTADAESQKSEIEFPAKELTIVVSNKAGGSNDAATRSFTPYLEEVLGVPVIVKNVDGAGGNIARAEVFRENPDGYTLLQTPMPSMAIGEIVADGDFSTLEFEPVFNVYGEESNVIIVPADSPYNSIDDIVEASKEKELTISGSGTATNAVLGNIFLKNIGVNSVYIPFKGGSESVQQVAGKHVDLGTSSEIAAEPLVKEGLVRVIASTGYERADRFPDAPTLLELGYEKSAFEIIYGYWAPPGTPKEIINTLADAFNEAVQDEEFKENAENLGFTTTPMMPKEFSEARQESYDLIVELNDFFDIE